MFFGLSTLALGYLVFKSASFPKALGVLLMVFVPFGYVMDSFTSFLIADKPVVLSVVFIAPAALVEFTFIGWLLVKGGSIREFATPRA